LEIINATWSTLDTVKTNPSAPGEKQIRVINTDTLEDKYLKEKDMYGGQWQEAAENYVTFVELIEGIGSTAAKRWHAHFGFFTNVADAELNFPAIRATDIALRRRYISRPFTYDRENYQVELAKEVNLLRIAEQVSRLEAKLAGSGGSASGSGSGSGGASSGSLRGNGFSSCGRSRGRGRGGGRGGAPFQQGSSGDALAVVCLVCTRRGHFYISCTATTFADGSPLHCVVHDRDIRTAGSQQTLCRIWNTRGASSNCSHDASARTHACSLCGSKNHYAFSWTCRQNPPL
jgi:hypothetical protein